MSQRAVDLICNLCVVVSYRLGSAPPADRRGRLRICLSCEADHWSTPAKRCSSRIKQASCYQESKQCMLHRPANVHTALIQMPACLIIICNPMLHPHTAQYRHTAQRSTCILAYNQRSSVVCAAWPCRSLQRPKRSFQTPSERYRCCSPSPMSTACPCWPTPSLPQAVLQLAEGTRCCWCSQPTRWAQGT